MDPKQARQQGLRFKWVQGDGAYGHDLKFCRNLDDLGERFLLDVHKNKRIYLEYPAVAVSEKGSKSAATSQRLRTKVKATTAQMKNKSFIFGRHSLYWPVTSIRNEVNELSSSCPKSDISCPLRT